MGQNGVSFKLKKCNIQKYFHESLQFILKLNMNKIYMKYEVKFQKLI